MRRQSKRIASVLAIVPLLGCEAMIRAGETLDACHARLGGTRSSCDSLAEQRRKQAQR